MRLNFQQGIVSYSQAGNVQTFLQRSGSNNQNVSLLTNNGPVDVTFAFGSVNYLHTESVNVIPAWVNVPQVNDAWIYWDINLLTGARTFGFTSLTPQYGSVIPQFPTDDLHWFDTVNKKMFVYHDNKWCSKLRTFAAKVSGPAFLPLGIGILNRPFAGTQVGLSNINIAAGRLVYDSDGLPIRRSDGRFFTSEDDTFINESPIANVRVETSFQTATAIENLAKNTVIVFPEFGKMRSATFNELQTQLVGVLMEDTQRNQVGRIMFQGILENPSWNWISPGAPLWILDGGEITTRNLNNENAVFYPEGKLPLARVITPTSIMFSPPIARPVSIGPAPPPPPPATTHSIGAVKLSVTPGDEDEPVVVETNDPRMTDARTPLTHTHAATLITFTPFHSITANNVELALQQIENNKVQKSGDTMTGTLTLTGSTTHLTITGGTTTVSAPLTQLTQTWNLSASTFIGTDINITNTASALDSRLSRWRVDGAEKAAITRSGDVLANGVSVKTLEALYWMGI